MSTEEKGPLEFENISNSEIIFFSSSGFAKPKVLECKKNCGTPLNG